MESTYEGGRQWFKENIFKFYKEGSEFDNRVKRAYRFNHTREVVDLINKYLFRGKVSRIEDDAPPSVREFWRNVDGKGQNIDEFMKIVSKKSSIVGRPWIVVDNRQTELDENASKADEEPNSIYAYAIMPEMVLDMSWDEDGNLNWILIQEAYRDDKDPYENDGETYLRFRLWDRENSTLISRENPKSKTSKYVSEVTPHNLGVVPVIPADNVISDEKYSSPALINDIAYLDRAVANYLSNLDEIIQDQTFSQLAIPAQAILPGDVGPDGEDEHAQLIEVGTKRVFTYDSEHGSVPMFLSPDPRQAQLILSAIQQIINEIYHSAGLAGERTKQDNAKGIDNSSGVAKAKDFERVNSLLIAKADSLESIELKIAYLVALWAGEEDSIEEDNELVTYPGTFDVKSLFDEFDIATQLSLLQVPESIRGIQMEEMAKKLFPSASKKVREEIKAQILEWVERMKEQKELSMEGLQASVDMSKDEGLRDRETSGDRQSATKQREANRVSESDQANGQ